MARALSDDLRHRVLAASAGGMSARSAAARLGIGISTAIAWIASARQGQVSAAKQGRPGGSRLDDHEAFIIGMIEASKDITLNEMVLRLEEDRSVSIGRSTLDVWLRKRGFTFKKRPRDCQEFCAVGRFHQLKNRSPKMTANCVFASTHS
ncbi:transposase, partial [Sinorhizobium meliloti]